MAEKQQLSLLFTRYENSSTGSLEKNLQLDASKFKSASEQGDEKPYIGQKMTVFQTSLALVAANIGGGLLGMPYALQQMGIYLGLSSTVLMAILSHFSTMMHLKVKDMTPRRYESMYEIAYLLMGRPSIFFVCLI